MKRAFLAASCALFLAANSFAQTSLSGLYPKDARSMGMGGAFRVFATGYQAFFGNPAGFSGPGTLTLGDVAAWAYVKPTPANIRDIVVASQSGVAQTDREALIGDLIAENGFGGGASVGLGWSGSGFGFGVTMVSDALATGTSYADASLKVRNQANVVFGMAWPLKLGAFTFSFGADIRAFYRLDSSDSWPFATLASAILSGQGYTATDVYSSLLAKGGYGFAMDTGATVAVGPLSAGIMVRDYGYRFYMDDVAVGDLVDSAAFPFGSGAAYALTPTYTAGLGLKFKHSKTLSSSFYAEADNPVTFVSDIAAGSDSAALDLLHAGGELKFLNFIALRAGYNEGFVSFGAGIDLALIEIDAAVFSERIDGAGSGRSGVTLQAAVRL